MATSQLDVDIDAGIAAWEARDFDGPWSNSGIATDRPLVTVVVDGGEVTQVPVMRALLWRELYERERENSHQLGQRGQLITDIDRCEHGRHLGDGCTGCAGPSLGNPLLRSGPVVLGYTIAGEPYVASQDHGYLRSEVRVEAGS